MGFTDPSVTEHLTWMRRVCRLSERTVEQRLTALASLARATGKPPLACTAADLDGWQRGLTVADASRVSYASQLVGFYSWAAERGLVESDPSAVLVFPRLPRRLPRPIGEEDLALVLTAANERIRPWLELAAYAGFRAGEVARLERRDVLDRANPRLLLVRGKGGKQRLVPMADRVWAALQSGLPASGVVFPRHDGRPGPNRPNTVSAAVSRHMHAAGVDASLHCLRHFFASSVFRTSGHNLRLVQDLLGHSSPATTAIYTGWSSEEAAAAVFALDTTRRAS